MPAIVTPERQALINKAIQLHSSGMTWKEIGSRLEIEDRNKLKSLQTVVNRKAREATGWRR